MTPRYKPRLSFLLKGREINPKRFKTLANRFNQLTQTSPRLRGMMWSYLYQFSVQLLPIEDWKFMNFGYASIDDKTEILELEKKDIHNRYPIQLYHHVASLIDIQNLTVLEVGSGRGGGADYIKRYLKPQSIVGIDLSNGLVDFCKRNYRVEGLSFKVGHAESLPFEDASFDILINIESSHCYHSLDKFFRQVKRVLCKGGYFLFADFRDVKDLTSLLEAVKKSGLTLIKQTDITLNVVKAMELDHERKIGWIKKSVIKPLMSVFSDLAGTKDSSIYQRFQNGEVVYQSFLLQKQTD